MRSPVISVAWAADPAETTPADKLKVWAEVRFMPVDFPIPPKMSWEALATVETGLTSV